MSNLIVIDVSHWQTPSTLNWKTAAGSGVVGIIVKCTQGSDGVDPAAGQHLLNAWKAGISLLGCYHFGDNSDPEAQAKFFVSTTMNHFTGVNLEGVMLMLDAERHPSGQMGAVGAGLFVSAVQRRLGRYPWIYMGRDGPDGARDGLPNANLERCPLLIPAYGPHDDDLSQYLPAGFAMPTNKTNRAGVCRGWQFTDGTTNGGPVPGLGLVDQSRLIGIDTLDEAKSIWAP